MIEELIGRVFATRNAAHLAHWKTKSYAQHVALGDFYDALPGHIDKIVEAYQGAFGPIEPKTLTFPAVSDITDHLNKEGVWIEENRTKIAKDVCAIENMLDELSGLYLTTIYKLENLK